MAVERGGNPPNAADAGGALLQLIQVVFLDPVGRIGHHGVNRVLRHAAEPLEAVGVQEQRLPEPLGCIVERQH
jgi:hypothetical protein